MRIHPQTIPELDASLKSAKTAVKLLEESLREARAADRASRACIGNRERIAGWTGPAGWRLQTHESKVVTCTCCGKEIPAREQHVGWCIPAFPAPPVDYTAALEADPNRRWAHVRCLHRLGQCFREHGSAASTGLRYPVWLHFHPGEVPTQLRDHPNWRDQP